jgi:hypothetical protein
MEILYSIFIGIIFGMIVGMIDGIGLLCRRDRGGGQRFPEGGGMGGARG